MLSLLAAACLVALAAILFWLSDALTADVVRRWRAYHGRPRRFVVTRRVDHDPTHFSIRVRPVTGRCQKFVAGQYLTVLGPMLPSGRAAERRYSLDCWDQVPKEFGLTIKREPDGRVSGWMHETLQPGVGVLCRPPRGDFILGPLAQSDRIVLIAAGVGITPLRAMLHKLQSQGHRGQITLHLTARSMAGLLFHDEFCELARHWSSLRYVPRLTGPEPGWKGATGRLGADDLADGEHHAAHYFICASHAMTEAVTALLGAAGVPSAQVHHELFATTGNSCGNFNVAVDGKVLPAEGFPSVMMAMEANGVPVPSDCRAGHCGLCRCRLIDGTVEHGAGLAVVLAEGEFLPCVAIPASDISVSLMSH